MKREELREAALEADRKKKEEVRVTLERELKNEKELRRIREERKQKLIAEPSGEEGTIKLRFRFSNGEMWSRRFLLSNTAADTLNYVGTHDSSTRNFKLVTSGGAHQVFTMDLTDSLSIMSMDIHDGELFNVSWKDIDFVKDDSIIIGPSSTNSMSADDSTLPCSFSSENDRQDEDLHENVLPEPLPSENEDNQDTLKMGDDDSSQENGSEPLYGSKGCS